jgi:hypothetical protein
MAKEVVTIDAPFYGFPGVGLGGYAAGLLADRVSGPLQVTLRKAPPLARPLQLQVTREGASLLDGSDVVAEAIPVDLEIEVPGRVSPADAAAASSAYPGFVAHPYPMCLTCGPDRSVGEGLRIFPGRVPGTEMVAAPWLPHPNFGQAELVKTEFVWSALDCPTVWGIWAGFTETGPLTTGRLSASIMGKVPVGEPAVVLGWPIESSGRKFVGGAAILSAGGEVLAVARAIWFEIPG